MKSLDEIKQARTKLCETIMIPGLSPVQRSLFVGMLNALVWVCEHHNGNTLERLLSGEPVAAGKDYSPAMDRLEKIIQEYNN